MNDEQQTGASQWPFIVHRLSLIVFLSIGVFLRWFHLGRESLWFDEGYTAWVISLSPAQLIRAIRVDTAPPLYYLLLHGWAGLFGRSEFALRSLSALFSTASLLLFYPLAFRFLSDRRLAAAALALFAVSEMQVAYAHEARLYTLVTLLAEIDLLLVLQAIDRPPAWWRYLLMIVAWTISLYTNNMLAVYLAALGLMWLILPGPRPWRRRVIDLVIVAIPAALLFLPWVPTLLAQSASLKGRFWTGPPDRRLIYRTLSVVCGWNEEALGWDWRRGVAVAAWIVTGIVLIGLVRPATHRRALALCAFGLLPILVVYIQSKLSQPIFMERAFIATTLVMPILLLLPFVPGRFHPPTWLMALFTAGWLVGSTLSLRLNYVGEHREQWRDACRAVDEGAARNRLIVFVANEGEMLYDYYSRHSDYSPSPNLIGVPTSIFAKDPPQTMMRIHSEADLYGLRAALGHREFDEVVFVESHPWFSDADRRVEKLLNASLPLLGHQEFTLIHVYRYGAASR
ncbi:MAG TPA: glycosyltransferase family 39 protein [Tepidisphaeraceae bacterium]|nr:glycosyltransferase family 39 protein [Tepidisphaeraceae bacterium]